MTVTEESEGRLNAFANEPEIEVIDINSSDNRTSRVLIIAGLVLIIALIRVSLTIK